MPSTKAKSLTERTGEALYDMILIQKQFKPGDKLPNEFELSARLGVSRATLREAVSALIAQGFWWSSAAAAHSSLTNCPA
jgi:DNA-binding FadR family transcriptional regulator